MKINELSVEDQNLLQTTFSPEMEKEAAEQADMINELYNGGSELAIGDADAMEKMAAEEKGDDDKKDDDDDDDEKKKAVEKLTEGQKKEASARGAFIARGYMENIMKLGSERYDDELAYLYPYLEEKVAGIKDIAARAWKATRGAAGSVRDVAKKAPDAARSATGTVKSAPGKATAYGKKYVKGIKADVTTATKGTKSFPLARTSQRTMKASAKERAAAGARAVGKTVGPLGAAAGLGYGAHAYRNRGQE